MSIILTYNVICDSRPLVSPPAIAAGAAGSFVVTDVDHLAAVFPSWDIRFIQIDPGQLHANVGCTRFGGLLDRRVRTDRKIQVRGIPRGSQYVFTLITEANECWRFRGGQRLRPGEIKIDSPGEELDEIYDAGSEGLSLEIDEAMLREALAMTSGKDPDEVLPRGFVLRPTAQAFRTFQSRLRQWVTLQVASQPEVTERDVAAQVLEDYLDSVCCLLVDDVQEGKSIGPRGGRLDLAREAEEIMESFPDRPLTTTDLCQQLCVSRRSLFYAFKDTFGVSPMAYYKTKRLSRVRTELKALDSASTTVREVAQRWGFHHAGQFAQDYSRHYDERPSDTLLKRRAPRAANLAVPPGRWLTRSSSLRVESLQEPSGTPRAPSHGLFSVPSQLPGAPDGR